MKALRFGFLSLIALLMVRILTVIGILNEDLYWMSPLLAIIELLINLNLDDLAEILYFVIYPSLGALCWLIMYIFILVSNSKRSIAKQRFLALSILGMIGVIISVGLHIFFMNIDYSENYMGTIVLISSVTGVFAIVLLIVVLILPNYGHLRQYKIVEVVGFLVNNVLMIFILPIIAISGVSQLFIIETPNFLFGLISIFSFYYLMKYLELENDEVIDPQNYLN